MSEPDFFTGEGHSEPVMGGVGEGAGDHWLVMIDCPRCGPQATVWVSSVDWLTGEHYGPPRAEDAYPPICPHCCFMGEPQATVVSIRHHGGPERTNRPE
jgi:hypothetical protein